jgi:hypothetical protein
MQQKTAQKLMHAESHAPLFVVAPGIAPTKRHVVAFQRQQSVTGYGDAMGIPT